MLILWKELLELIITRIIKMPDCGAEAFTIADADGNFNVYINAALSQDGRIRAYNHELKHIANGDFDKWDVQQIETEVRK